MVSSPKGIFAGVPERVCSGYVRVARAGEQLGNAPAERPLRPLRQTNTRRYRIGRDVAETSGSSFDSGSDINKTSRIQVLRTSRNEGSRRSRERPRNHEECPFSQMSKSVGNNAVLLRSDRGPRFGSQL